MNLFLITSVLQCLSLLCLCTALIRPADNFNVEGDAKRLREAVGSGTGKFKNADGVMAILTRRTEIQRLAIVKHYNTQFKPNLSISKDYLEMFRNIFHALTTPLSIFYAKELSRNPADAFDVLLTSSNAVLKAVEEEYLRVKEAPTDNLPEIISRKNLLTNNVVWGALRGLRNETQEVDEKAAVKDAEMIRDIGEHKDGRSRTVAEQEAVEEIFITRSHRQLHKIIHEYYKLNKDGINAAFINRGWSTTMEKSFLNMIGVFWSTPVYYASRLRDSFGTFYIDIEVVVRIIVGRSEIDLDEIKEEFQKKTGGSLDGKIGHKIAKNSADALRAIVNSQN